jgi:hypothetical protein
MMRGPQGHVLNRLFVREKGFSIRYCSRSLAFPFTRQTKYWEIIADKLSKAGWSWGCVSAIDSNGRTIWIADAHRGDGKRFVMRADEKLTAFLELERITHELAVSALLRDDNH